MSGDRASPRFDLVASTRRQFTDAQKQAIVAEVDAGGIVSEVARRHNVHASLLFRWRRDYAIRKPATPKPVKAATFLPVTVTPARARSKGINDWRTASSFIEIEVAGGRKLRVNGDIDLSLLKRLVVALETLA
jgi:transposase